MLLTVMTGIDPLGLIAINADCIADPALEAPSRLPQSAGRTEIPAALSRARGWNPFPWPCRGDCVNFNKLPILLAALQKQGQIFRYSQLAFEAYSLVENEPLYWLWDVTAKHWLTKPELYNPSQSMPLAIEQGGAQGRIQKPLHTGKRNAALPTLLVFSTS